MSTKLHHINFSTENVERLQGFYLDVLKLDIETTSQSRRISGGGYDGQTGFITDGAVDIHFAQKDLGVAHRTKQFLNPLERGHVAFRTDDIEGVKKRLDEKGVPFADYGGFAMSGWAQIFFQDPDGNIIEVHQVLA